MFIASNKVQKFSEILQNFKFYPRKGNKTVASAEIANIYKTVASAEIANIYHFSW